MFWTIARSAGRLTLMLLACPSLMLVASITTFALSAGQRSGSRYDPAASVNTRSVGFSEISPFETESVT